MTTLFVNACMRGEDSRTLALCREYLQGKEEVVEVDLATLGLKPFDAQMVAYRTAEGEGMGRSHLRPVAPVRRGR